MSQEPRKPRLPRRKNHTRAAPLLADRLQYGVLVAVTFLLERLGVDAASALMGFLWRHLAPFDKRHRRALAHLRFAFPDRSEAERERIVRDMWENLGRTAAETLLLPRLVADPSRFELRDEPIRPHVEDLRKGAIFAALHQGNWELCGWGIHLAGFKVAAVYQALKNPLAEDFLREKRLAIYDSGLFPRDRATALKLRSQVRAGVAVGMLADLRDHTGIVMDFFGKPAQVASFPAVLARRLGVPLIVGRVVRTKGVRFRIEAMPVEMPSTDDVEADITAATVALHRQFERWIADAPEQWMWANKKWPAGTTPEY
jgi:KDO2-lipid IV(A) lauroyltransferase